MLRRDVAGVVCIVCIPHCAVNCCIVLPVLWRAVADGMFIVCLPYGTINGCVVLPVLC
jgi:hypothetical protein